MSEYGSMGHEELSSRASNGDSYAAAVMNERQQMEMASRTSANGPSYVPNYRGSPSGYSDGPSIVTDLFRLKAFLVWGLLPGALYYFHLLGQRSPGNFALAISAAGMFVTSKQLRRFIFRIVLVAILFFLATQLLFYFGQHQSPR